MSGHKPSKGERDILALGLENAVNQFFCAGHGRRAHRSIERAHVEACDLARHERDAHAKLDSLPRRRKKSAVRGFFEAAILDLQDGVDVAVIIQEITIDTEFAKGAKIRADDNTTIEKWPHTRTNAHRDSCIDMRFEIRVMSSHEQRQFIAKAGY